jgi:hypothetical protein
VLISFLFFFFPRSFRDWPIALYLLGKFSNTCSAISPMPNFKKAPPPLSECC